MAEVERVGVVGAGTMGNGIAHVFARSGFPVVLAEADQAALDRGLGTVEKNLAREVAKGKLAQADADSARARITGTLERTALGGCDLVVEAATERFAIKQSLFQELDSLLGAEAILASNTSSISITKLAADDETSGPGYRDALLQSRARNATHRGDSRPADLAGHL